LLARKLACCCRSTLKQESHLLVEFISASAFALFSAPFVGYLVALQLISLMQNKTCDKSLK